MKYSGNGFSIEIKDSIPVVTGKIPIGKGFKGNIGVVKLGEWKTGFGTGSPIKVSPGGYFIDELASVEQKDIRRALLIAALFWAKELYDMGGPFRNFLINRLMVIVSEDVGIANSPLVFFIKEDLVLYYDLEKNFWVHGNGIKMEKLIMGIVKALVLSSKSRICDSIIHAIMEFMLKSESYPDGIKEFIISKMYGKSEFKRQSGDSDVFVECAKKFEDSLKRKNPVDACYWFQKIYEINKWNEGRRHTSNQSPRGNGSFDPVYGVWEILLKATIGGWKMDSAVINSLMWLYDRKKSTHRTERLFVVHAILHLCYMDKIRHLWWGFEERKKYFEIDDELWKTIQKHEKIPMPDYAIDKHTVRGRIKKKTSKDFWTEGAKLKNEVLKELDVYYETAKWANGERDRLNIKGPKRPKQKKSPKKKGSKKKTPKIRGKKRKRNIGDIGKREKKQRKITKYVINLTTTK